MSVPVWAPLLYEHFSKLVDHLTSAFADCGITHKRIEIHELIELEEIPLSDFACIGYQIARVSAVECNLLKSAFIGIGCEYAAIRNAVCPHKRSIET